MRIYASKAYWDENHFIHQLLVRLPCGGIESLKHRALIGKNSFITHVILILILLLNDSMDNKWKENKYDMKLKWLEYFPTVSTKQNIVNNPAYHTNLSNRLSLAMNDMCTWHSEHLILWDSRLWFMSHWIRQFSWWVVVQFAIKGLSVSL